MDYDTLVDECSLFGISFKDESVYNTLNYFVTSNSCDSTKTIDALVAYAKNNKIDVVTDKIIQEFINNLSSNITEFHENVPPPSNMQSLPKTVKKEIIDDKPVHENDSEPLKVSTTMHGKVCVKLALQEGYNTHGLQLIPNAFAADEHVDAIEANMLPHGADVSAEGRVAKMGTNDNDDVFLFSKKYGNIKMDLTNVKNEYIFDRMNITVDGTLYGNELKVNRIASPDLLQNAEVVCSSLKLLSDFAPLMVACGPFNDSSGLYPTKLIKVFNHAISIGAKLVVLYGPVLTVADNPPHSRPIATGLVFDAFLDAVMNMAAKRLDVIVVPAVKNDYFVNYPQYPTSAYSSEKYNSEYLLSKRIYLFENPSVFNYDGIRIAIANFDTMEALLKGSLITTAELPTNDRMQWFLQQMLQNGHLCPSYNRPETLNEYKFTNIPALFICPSKLRRLAVSINNVVFVNLCTAGGNGLCAIQPKCLETNGENIQLQFDTSFLTR